MLTKKKFLRKKNFLYEKNIRPKGFKKIDFFWINDFDARTYLKNRNNRSISKFFFNKKISVDEHNTFLKKYKKLARIDFIIRHNKKTMIGFLSLKYDLKRYSIGKFISNKNFRKKGIMKKAFINFVKYLNSYYKIKFIYSETFKTNKDNINFNFMNGFKIIDKFKNVVLMRKKMF